MEEDFSANTKNLKGRVRQGGTHPVKAGFMATMAKALFTVELCACSYKTYRSPSVKF